MADPITIQNVFARLVAIAATTNGGSRGDTLLSCDLVDQEALFTLQEQFAALLADVANACGPDAARRLEREFPYAFKRS